MKNFAGILGIITLVLIIGFSMIACDDGGGGGGDNGVTLPKSSGTNEVAGKPLYLSDTDKFVFAAAGTAFTGYRLDYFIDEEEELVSEGSYSYNSDNHTITLAIEYVYRWYNEEGNRINTKMNKTQAKNAASKECDDYIALLRERGNDINDINDMLADWGYNSIAAYKEAGLSEVDEEFAPTTYDYQLTDDGELLVQEKLPDNKGSNELSGKSFGRSGYNTYTFTESGYEYGGRTTTGTYAYDSAAKRVWLRPENKSSKTMSEFYTTSSGAGTAAQRAGSTNSAFRVERRLRYGLTPSNWIDY
jgi:hypothetical protein